MVLHYESALLISKDYETTSTYKAPRYLFALDA